MTGSVCVVSRARSLRQISGPDTTGQHPVEDDKVGRVLGEAELGFVAPFYSLDDIAFCFQIVSEQQRQIRFVLDDEDARLRGGLRANNLLAGLIHTSPSAASKSVS